MSLENPDQTQPFRAPQDEIQWGILLLTKQLQNRDLQEREQYLQELWEWARQRADLLSRALPTFWLKLLKKADIVRNRGHVI